jgi:hypothetical protein
LNLICNISLLFFGIIEIGNSTILYIDFLKLLKHHSSGALYDDAGS